MKALRFRLSGKTAFFKQPDVNTYLYYTYGQIHRVALLGLLGAIKGYKGYSDNDRTAYPEFYKKLKELKISIVSDSVDGIFERKIHTFNNSTGLASNEKGGVLVVKQVWLENPSWYIYILLDSEESEKISDFILNKKARYIPYLGSNDHMAKISEVSLVDLELSNDSKIDSIFDAEDFKIKLGRKSYKYEEYLPFKLEENTERYIYNKAISTDGKIVGKTKDDTLFKDDINSLNLAFYSEEGIYENK